MKTRLATLLVLCLAVADGAPPFAQEAGGADSEGGIVWVFFRDKETGVVDAHSAAAASARFAPRRASRMLRAGAVDDERDLPVSERYVRELSFAGARVRTTSRWLNAASCEASADVLDQLRALPCVLRIEPVGRSLPRREPARANAQVPSAEPAADLLALPYDYGLSFSQSWQLNVPELHALGLSGDSVLIAVFDAGFRLVHEAFDSLVSSGRVIAKYDFIFADTGVANDSLDVAGQDQHGTWVLGTLAGFAPGELVGPAFGARYMLAKTEDIRSETPVEEDYYVAALEWADSAGADIVTSSLSYDFGYVMNGAQGKSTIAANTAAARGILLCTAMGNSGPGPATLGAPADAFNIVAVGAVDAQGQIASFSSRGPTADLRIKPEVCARGVSDYTVSASNATEYVTVSGTSFATPLTAASAALLLSAHRDWGPLALRAALMQSGDHAHIPDNNYGWGIFDLLAALEATPPGTLDLRNLDQVDRYDTSPWAIRAAVHAAGDRLPAAVSLHYRYEPGIADSVTMTPVDDTIWSATLPFTGEERLLYHFGAIDSAGRASRFPPTGGREFELLRGPDSLAEGFEHGGLRWARANLGPPSPGPCRPLWWTSALAAASGRFALTDSPRGPYPPSANEAIEMTAPLVVATGGLWDVGYASRFQMAAGDTGFVEWRLGLGGAWTALDTVLGTEPGWLPRVHSLSLAAGDSLFARFRLKSDDVAEGDGWFIDDFRIAASPSAVDPIDPPRPSAFHLGPNFPNPFNPATRIEFELPLPARVTLTVYNVVGRRVKTLVSESLAAGPHMVEWDGKDELGRPAASGVYFCRMNAGEFRATRRMILVR